MNSRLLTAVLTTAILAAAPASALATSIGDVTSRPALPGTSGNYDEQISDGTSAAYRVPAGGGIVTSVSAVTTLHGQAGSLRIFLDAAAGGGRRIAGHADIAVPAGSGISTLSAPARFAVEGSEFMAVRGSDGAEPAATPAPGATIAVKAMTMDPADGPFDFSGSKTFSDVALLIAATVEPDADHDGFGDQSQDSCPSKASVHTGACDPAPAPAPAQPAAVRPAPAPAATAPSVTAAMQARPAAQPSRTCRVPALRGMTDKRARRALAKAGCARGRITGPKKSRARVIRQTVRPGITIRTGTKVGYALRSRRPAR